MVWSVRPTNACSGEIISGALRPNMQSGYTIDYFSEQKEDRAER